MRAGTRASHLAPSSCLLPPHMTLCPDSCGTCVGQCKTQLGDRCPTLSPGCENPVSQCDPHAPQWPPECPFYRVILLHIVSLRADLSSKHSWLVMEQPARSRFFGRAVNADNAALAGPIPIGPWLYGVRHGCPAPPAPRSMKSPLLSQSNAPALHRPDLWG